MNGFTSSQRKALALTLAVVLAILIIPAIPVTAHGAAREIDVASLNAGTATDAFYDEGDTLWVVGLASMTDIGWRTLDTFTKSYRLILNEATTEIPARPLSGIVGVPNTKMIKVEGRGVLKIGDRAFSRFGGLEEAVFINVKEIGDNAFDHCEALIDIKAASVQTIGVYAFDSCTALTFVEFPEATSIGKYAFNNCGSLDRAILSKLTGIDDGLFYSCGALNIVYTPVATSIGGRAFFNATSLVNVSFPLVETIGEHAFANSGIVGVIFPSVTAMEDGAFYNCPQLRSASFPKATTVAGYAFGSNPLMTHVDLPVVVTIGESAFYASDALRSLVLPSQKPVIGDNAFVHVPQGLIVYVENPGDPSYLDKSGFPVGVIIRDIRDKGVIYDNTPQGPQTPAGVGGGLVGSVTAAMKETPMILGQGIVTANRLNVRSTPDTALGSLGQLTRNTVVFVEAIENNFARIVFMGKTGYVSLDYLELDFEVVQGDR